MTVRRAQSLRYLRKKAEMDLAASKVAMDLLLEHGVGVGEHSVKDFHDNLDEALDLMVDAQDRLDMLDSLDDD